MRKRIASVVAVLCLTAGCRVVSASRFRVVDASDGHPVAGVHAEGTLDMWQPSTVLGWWVHCRFPTGSGTSDETGLVQFDGTQSEVAFTKEGYEPCNAVVGRLGYRPRNKFLTLRTFPWEDGQTPLILLQPRPHE